MIIEKMSDGHVKSVERLLSACFVHPWSEQTLRSTMKKGNAFLTVAVEGGETVAFLSFEKVLDEGSVELIAVDERYRRQGIAKRLLKQMFSSFDDLHTVFLEVRETNHSARALYESLGFEVVAVRKNYYAELHEDAVVMQKSMNNEWIEGQTR